MKKITGLFITILFLSGICKSQDLDWVFEMKYNDNGYYGFGVNEYFIVDNAGNSVVGGHFLDTVDFDPDTTVHNLVSGFCHDHFLAKYNNNGKLSWAHKIDLNSLSGFNNLYISHIQVDGSNNIYIVGYFRGSIIFKSSSASDTVLGPRGHNDIFIAKYSYSGHLLWVKRIAGELDSSRPTGLHVSTNGDIFICGVFVERIYFNYPSKSISTSIYGDITKLSENFLVKFDNSGNFKWNKLITGPDFAANIDMLVDVNQNIFLSGLIKDSIYLNSSANLIATPRSGRDIFITKITSGGTIQKTNLIWSNGVQKRTIDMDIDPSGNVVVIGSFGADTLYFDTSGFVTSNIFSEYYIVKYDNNLNFSWAYSLNTSSNKIRINTVDLDNIGNINLGGWFSGKSDFDLSQDTFFLTIPGSFSNGFLAIYDSVLHPINVLPFEFPSQSQSYINIIGIGTDPLNNIYVEGVFRDSVDFDPSQDTFYLNGGHNTRITQSPCPIFTSIWGTESSFIARYNYCEPPEIISGPGPNSGCKGSNATILVVHVGTPPITYQWYKDSKPMTGETNASLTFTNIQYADSGIYTIVLTSKCGVIASDPLEFKVGDCTGIDEPEEHIDFMIYPNPTNGEFTVELRDTYTKILVEVTNPMGQVISITTYQNSSSIQQKIEDVSGIYLIRVTTDNGKSALFRILKE